MGNKKKWADSELQVLTPTQFAKKIKVSRATIYRWISNAHLNKYFKMHDAEMITIAGRIFIQRTL